MPVQRPLWAVPAVVALLIGLGGCGASSDQPTAADLAAPAPPASAKASDSGAANSQQAVAGAYLTEKQYAAKKASRAGTKVVLFFHAPWCSSCRATEKSLEKTGVPSGLTVVKVDYDSNTALRKQLGVTVQHTFVELNAKGRPIAKFSGAVSGADIMAGTV